MVTSIPMRAETSRNRPDMTNSTSKTAKAVIANPEEISSLNGRGGRPCMALRMSGATAITI
jgi:hypothetical protein